MRGEIGLSLSMVNFPPNRILGPQLASSLPVVLSVFLVAFNYPLP
jgi:hypothetical protein